MVAVVVFMGVVVFTVAIGNTWDRCLKFRRQALAASSACASNAEIGVQTSRCCSKDERVVLNRVWS